MSGQSATCQYKGCRRTVRLDYAFYPFCHDHRQSSGEWQEALASVRDFDLGSSRVPPKATMDPHQVASTLYRSGTPARADVAEAVPVAMEKFSAGQDLTVPANARQRLLLAANDFRSAMESCGIDPRRMKVMLRVEGMNRLILMDDRPAITQRNPSINHTALTVDYGTPNQVVVDPAISFFAPVRNTSSPVETELASGETQFGDSPWVGTVLDYVESATLWWDRSWVVSA